MSVARGAHCLGEEGVRLEAAAAREREHKAEHARWGAEGQRVAEEIVQLAEARSLALVEAPGPRVGGEGVLHPEGEGELGGVLNERVHLEDLELEVVERLRLSVRVVFLGVSLREREAHARGERRAAAAAAEAVQVQLAQKDRLRRARPGR